MTYDQLSQPRPHTALPGGGTLIARQPVLFCPECGETFSANPGDYWNAQPSAEITCGACETLLVLVETQKALIPYDTNHAFDQAVAGLWNAQERES